MTDVKRVREIKNSPPLRVVDVIIMAILTIIVVCCALIPYFTAPTGSMLEVTVDGRTTSYSMSSNKVIIFDGMTVEIIDGQASVTFTDCPDKVCQHTGKISKVNQSIVCLPKNIVIRVVGKSDFQVETGGGV